MPPKTRKRPLKGSSNGPPPKRQAQEKNRRNGSKEVEHPSPTKTGNPSSAKGPEQPKKREVRWVLPEGPNRKVKYDANAAEEFAPVLFEQPFNELDNVQKEMLKPPPMPSPLLLEVPERNRGRQSKLETLHNKVGSSEQLHSFYNELHDHTESQDENSEYLRLLRGEGLIYRGVHRGLLATRDQRASFLEQDEELEVILSQPNGDEQERASVTIIRRATPSDEQVVEIFLVVPPGTSVAVNGLTYTNGGSEGDMFIGPLHHFTIIELLSQPAFVWRNRSSFLFENNKSQSGTVLSITDMERKKESKRKHVMPKDAVARVTSRLLEPAQPGDEQDESVRDGVQEGVRDGEQENERDGEQENERGGEKEDEREENEVDIANARYSSYLRTRIDDLAAQLAPHPNDPEDLMNAVLLAINVLQPEDSGFSLDIDGVNYRPGQPRFLPIQSPGGYVVLLIIQLRSPGEITVNIMDPKEWNTDRKYREEISTVAWRRAWEKSWVKGCGLPQDDLVANSSDHAYWIDSPQTTDDNEASTITVLNAWALAMGLQPNPDWSFPVAPGYASFLRDAYDLFAIARSGQHLDWNLVYAFFRTYGFIRDEDVDPPENRRFDLSAISAEDRKHKQILQKRTQGDESKWSEDFREMLPKFKDIRRWDEDFQSDKQSRQFKEKVVKTLVKRNAWRRDFPEVEIEEIYAGLDPAATPIASPKAHPQLGMKRLPGNNATVAPEGSSSQPRDHPKHGDKRLTGEHATLPPKDGPRASSKRGSDVASTSPQKSKSPLSRQSRSSSASSQLERDTSELPENFNPCEYLRQKLEELSKHRKLASNGSPADITAREINDSIAAVVQAVGHAEGPPHSFEYVDYSALETFEPNSQADLSSAIRYNGQRTLILPWSSGHRKDDPAREGDRSVLLILQPEVPEKSGNLKHPKRFFTVCTLDSAPWFSDQMERIKTHDSLSKLTTYMTGLKSDEIKYLRMNWVFGPPPNSTEKWELSYFTIFFAWALALDLEVDLDFRATPEFFEQSRQMVQLVLAGVADWKLIWSFLRCKEFVKAGETPPARRFRRTVAAKRLLTSLKKLKSGGEQLELPGKSSIYKFPEIFFQHDQRTNTDDWQRQNFEDLKFMLDQDISASGWGREAMYDASVREREYMPVLQDTDEMPSGPPCEALRKGIQELSKQKNTLKWVSKLQNDANEFTSKGGQWLRVQEVSEAIASVTVGITSMYEEGAGYSFLHPDDVDGCKWVEEIISIDDAIRPCQPMLIPIDHNNHIMLLIITLDSKSGAVNFQVHDSRIWHHKRADRNKIYQHAVRILERSHWGRKQFPGNMKVPAPESITWVPCAPQTLDWSCGYHAIFNAWAFALGLTPNYDFVQDWSKKSQFFKDAQSIISLARVGELYWELLVAFLECYKFVNIEPHENIRPWARFSNTLRIMHESYLKHRLQIIGHKERKNRERAERAEIFHHSEDSKWPGKVFKHNTDWNSDTWDEHCKSYVSELAQQHRLILTDDRGQLFHRLAMLSKSFREHQHNSNVIDEVDEGFSKSLGSADVTRSEMVQKFQDYIGLWPKSEQAAIMSDESIEKDPCFFAKQFKDHYVKLRKIMRKNLKPNDTVVQLPRQMDQDLEIDQVMPGIAAVVQAIDMKQAEMHSKRNDGNSKVFAGGFTLAGTGAIMEAVSHSCDYSWASRPRRCWLMPVILDGQTLREHELFDHPEKPGKEDKGHIILAVLQEEETEDGSTFRVYIFDSSPDFLSEARSLIFQRAKKVAGELKWSTHRNNGYNLGGKTNCITFEPKLHYVSTGRQTTQYQCGYHTILNAWILALGLTPSRLATFNASTYVAIRNLINHGLAGCLDWQTLVAFLFCKKLTVEKKMNAVPENRRFTAAVAQRFNGLSKYCHGVYEDVHFPIETIGEQELPYDHTNNVDFSQRPWMITSYDVDDEESSNKKDGKKEDQSTALGRAFEDVDEWNEWDEWSDTEYLLALVQHIKRKKGYIRRSAPRSRLSNSFRAGKRDGRRR